MKNKIVGIDNVRNHKELEQWLKHLKSLTSEIKVSQVDDLISDIEELLDCKSVATQVMPILEQAKGGIDMKDKLDENWQYIANTKEDWICLNNILRVYANHDFKDNQAQVIIDYESRHEGIVINFKSESERNDFLNRIKAKLYETRT